MPLFRYEAMGAAANAGTIEADDRAAATRLLLARGITPKRIVEDAARQRTPAANAGARTRPASTASTRRADSPAGAFPFSQRSSMTRREMATLIRELSVAMRAGLPLVPSLKTIARQGRSPAQKAMLESIIKDVEQGRTLADAMRSVGKPFDDLVIALVNAGEASGRMGEVMDHAATLLDRAARLRGQILGALLYPAVLMVFIVGAIITIVTVVVPQVIASAEGQITVMPWPTRVVQGMANLMTDWWWAMAIGAALALVIARAAWRSPAPRLAIDSFMLRAPALGTLVRDIAVARFTRTFGTLTGAGLPVLQSLRIVRDTLGNAALTAAMDEVADEVAHGRTIAEPMERSGLFPPLLIQVTAMGEKTGRLDQMLTEAADVFEEKTERSLKVVTTLLPPMLIVGAAFAVVFILLAIFLPLLELQESIG
ncbi:MAG: type II secretion system F family protein [Phycisphaerales bacterium]